MLFDMLRFTETVMDEINEFTITLLTLTCIRGDQGYMGQGLDGTSQFSACSRNIFFIIFIPYMGINITHTEKNFHRNCTSSL